VPNTDVTAAILRVRLNPGNVLARSPGSSPSTTSAILAMLVTLCVWAQRIPTAKAADQQTAQSTQQLEQVVVTGSLIPQIQGETSTPVTVITAEEMQERGFATVAEALQHAAFSTGSVQGADYYGGFTQGAKTLSLFGLNESYVKYLIDGRPMGDYPALYNGTDSFVSISGIPTVLVDHIDILPGGQSSIYGSDAIAGVINIVLKKKMDGPMLDFRYGFTSDGGGEDTRFGAADSVSFGKLTILVGGQYEKMDPIWGYQRDLTNQFYTNGSSPQIAYPNLAVISGSTGDYYFEDPAGCANVAGLFGGSEREYTRAGLGSYCGSTTSGFYTISNADESTQGYLSVTDDLTDHLQLYGDVLLSHDVTRFGTGLGVFNSDYVSNDYSYYYDPRLNDIANLQHVFSPEEEGGLNSALDKNTLNGVRGNLGLKGAFGSSDWNYDVGMTYSRQKLTEATFLQFTDEIEDFFAPIFGPNLGYNATQNAYTYEPNYAAFYQPITPAQFHSFSGYATNYSYTEDSMVRGQLTDASLFSLPGGHAGLALVLEGGDQGWNYAPDPRYLDGETFGYSSANGSGHRSRYAATGELRLPLFKMLTASVSGRYDDYRVSGQNVDKATYNLGVEFRPLETLLLRGRYGTSFKAPTLADEYQGNTGFYQQATDYYGCSQLGYSGNTLGNCPYFNVPTFGTTSGNTKLRPITAEDWDIGTAWAPVRHMSLTMDYIHWLINNEVTEQGADLILRTESQCRLGVLNINSPTCVAAIDAVTRDANGILISVSTPKINVSQEVLGVFVLGLNYDLPAGRLGSFELKASWSNTLHHYETIYAGDQPINLLTNAFYSDEFKTKANASVTWTKGDWSGTVYVERYGHTPNYLAGLSETPTPGGGNLATWALCTLSARYQITPTLELSASVEDVFNTMPPVDKSIPGDQNQPYDYLDYNIIGRSFFVEFSYQVGKK